MTVFRTDGAWGAGKGSNLTPAEVDENFYDFLQRIEILESDPPEAISIASVTVSGNTFTIHYTDGHIDGPFDLPAATFTVVPWEPDTLYVPNTFVTYGQNTYLVLFPHTSAATFDPNANDGLGHNFYGLLPFPNAPVIEWLDTGWQPNTSMGAFKLFSVPDVGVFLSLQAHTTGDTFDPLLTQGGLPVYQKIFGAIETDVARIQFQFAGAPPSDGSTVLSFINGDLRDLAFDDGWPESAAHLEVAVTATQAWELSHNDVAIGTITFSPGDLLDGRGGQYGTFAGAGTGASPIPNFEILRIKAPHSADATAKFLSVVLVGHYIDVES